MKRDKVNRPIVVTTVLEKRQHDALRYISFRENLPMAKLIRKTLDQFIKEKSEEYPIPIEELEAT